MLTIVQNAKLLPNRHQTFCEAFPGVPKLPKLSGVSNQNLVGLVFPRASAHPCRRTPLSPCWAPTYLHTSRTLARLFSPRRAPHPQPAACPYQTSVRIMADTGDEQDCSSEDSNDSGEDSEEFDCNCEGDQAENCTCFDGTDFDQLRPPVVHYHQHFYSPAFLLPSASPSFISPPHLGPPQMAPSTLPAPSYLPATHEPPPPYDPDDEQHSDEQEPEEQGRYDRLPYDHPPPPPPDFSRLPETGRKKRHRGAKKTAKKTVSAVRAQPSHHGNPAIPPPSGSSSEEDDRPILPLWAWRDTTTRERHDHQGTQPVAGRDARHSSARGERQSTRRR